MSILVVYSTTFKLNQPMNVDFMDANKLFQLVVDQRMQALELLSQFQRQNQLLITLSEQQQILLAQNQQVIDQLRAELRHYQTNQQQVFGTVHSN